jgi:hypothetical protein
MHDDTPYHFFKGMTFRFEEANNTIQVWYSNWSGKEVITVNGQVVSTRRQFGLNSTHPFQIGGDAYSVNMRTTRRLKGPLVCTLSKGSEPILRQQLGFSKAEPQENHKQPDLKRRATQFLQGAGAWMVIALLFFTVQKQLQLSRWVAFSALVLLGFGYELYRARHSHAFTATILKEDLRSHVPEHTPLSE